MAATLRIGGLTSLACAVVTMVTGLGPAATSAAVANPSRVRLPASDKYTGHAGRDKKLDLWVSGKSVQLIMLQFGCGRAVGTTNLDDIGLRRTRAGYRFGLRAHGSVSFTDGRPDENAAISIRGQFSAPGRSVRGTFSVAVPHCRRTGTVRWSARR